MFWGFIINKSELKSVQVSRAAFWQLWSMAASIDGCPHFGYKSVK